MGGSDFRVLSYVAGLEMAVDRLRKQWRLLHDEAGEVVLKIDALCGESIPVTASRLNEIRTTTADFSNLLHDLDDPELEQAGPDRVSEIAFRPLVEQVFRRHQRLAGAGQVQLKLELDCEQIVWFPNRLRHILENLLANAVKYHDPLKGEARVQVGLRRTSDGYELRVADNGLGLSRNAQARLFELFDRAGTAHLADPVVGLAVLKLLIEQSGGTLSVESLEGQGASFVAVLPRFELADYLL